MDPASRDDILSTEKEKSLWQPCFTAAPERRREFEPSFPKVERKDQRFSPALRAEPHNRYEVALSLDNHRCAYGSNEAKKLHLWPGPFQPCPCDTLAEKCLGDLNDDRTFHDVRRAGLDIRDILLDPFARDFQAFVGACLVRANRH